MSLELGCTLNDGDMIEILQPGHQHWAIYVGNGNIVHITDWWIVRYCPDFYYYSYARLACLHAVTRRAASTPLQDYMVNVFDAERNITQGRIVGSGDDSVHGNSVVKKSALEAEAKGCGFKVNNIYHGDLVPIPKEEVISSALGIVGESKPYGSCCKNFALELKYGQANLDIIIRNVMPIPGEIAVAAAKGVKVMGSAVSSSSDIVGSIAAKGVDLAGQGLTAMSDTVGTVAGKGVAAFGNMLSIGAQTLAPIIAAKADAMSAGSGMMVLTAADYIAPLAESLSGDAQEATAQSIMQLGSSVSSSSTSVGSAVSTGLSWLGSASVAGASSLMGYFKSGAEPINQTDENPNILEVYEKGTCNKHE